MRYRAKSLDSFVRSNGLTSSCPRRGADGDRDPVRWRGGGVGWGLKGWGGGGIAKDTLSPPK